MRKKTSEDAVHDHLGNVRMLYGWYINKQLESLVQAILAIDLDQTGDQIKHQVAHIQRTIKDFVPGGRW